MTSQVFFDNKGWSISYHESRAAEIRRKIASGGLYILGPGANGSKIASVCAKHNIKVCGFIDESEPRTKSQWVGLPVYGPDNVPSDLRYVIVSVFNPRVGFSEICERRGWPRDIAISVHEFAGAYTEEFLPFYFIGSAQRYYREQDDYRWLFSRLENQESKAILSAHLNLKLHYEFNSLGAELKTDAPPAEWGEFIFVDAGAFDGDTLAPFLENHYDRVIKAIALEPDRSNFARLEDRVRNLPAHIRNKVSAQNVAVSDTLGSFAFEAFGNQGSRLSSEGADLIRTITLDKLLECVDHPCLIKIDVEGAEEKALIGAAERMSRGKVALAVSLYHKPEDLIKVPKLIHSYCPSAKFYITNCGKDGADLMLVAHCP